MWREHQALFGAFEIGLALACVALIGILLVYKDRGLSEYSFWVSLLLYSFLILAAITVGRFDLGHERAGGLGGPHLLAYSS